MVLWPWAAHKVHPALFARPESDTLFPVKSPVLNTAAIAPQKKEEEGILLYLR